MCQMDPAASEITAITHTHVHMLADSTDILDSSENPKIRKLLYTISAFAFEIVSNVTCVFNPKGI